MNGRTRRFDLPDTTAINEQTVLANARPCPFSGSSDLSMNVWNLDEGEADAIECNECLGSAPARRWNSRIEDTFEEVVTASAEA